jgi:hypothetical protein
LKGIANKAEHEYHKLNDTVERKINRLQRQVAEAVECRVNTEASFEKKTLELELFQRRVAKERRQLEFDKAELAFQSKVSQNEAARLKIREENLKTQRQNLKQFRSQGQTIIDKAVRQQSEALESNTKVRCRYLFLCFFA